MRFFKYFMALSIICLLTYCSKTIKKPEPVQIVTSADYEPFSYKNSKGELIGFEIELMKEIMHRLHQEYTIEELNFDEIFNALEGDRINMAISAIGVTPDRKERFDFSTPYIKSPYSLVLSIDNTATTLDDLNPKSIFIQTSSSHPTILKKLLEKYPDVSIVEMKDISKIMEEFRKNFDKGTIIILDQAVASQLLKTDHELKIRMMEFQDEGFDLAIALPKGSKWLKPINKIIKELQNDGTIKDLKQKYHLEN